MFSIKMLRQRWLKLKSFLLLLQWFSSQLVFLCPHKRVSKRIKMDLKLAVVTYVIECKARARVSVCVCVCVCVCACVCVSRGVCVYARVYV